MPLTDTQIRNAKPREKQYKLFDSGGLYLLVRPTGSKLWRFKFRLDGKEKALSFGKYPDVSLAKAREERDKNRALVADGINPSDAVKAQRVAIVPFEDVARKWYATKLPNWAPGSAESVRMRLETYIFPVLGSKPIADITAPDIHAMLEPIQERGTYETCHRILAIVKQVFDHAVVTGYVKYNPAPSVKATLTKAKPKHMSATTEPAAFGKLLTRIDSYNESIVVRSALKLAPLLFARPGDLRHAKWADMKLDVTDPQWEYTVQKTKQSHIVPLPEQAVAILRELREHTGLQPYCFPGTRHNGRPMSENTLAAALRVLGISKEQQTVHGFRASARTMLDERLGVAPHLIEHQLAHTVKDALGRSYNRTQHLKDRRRMMQEWSDYLDNLREDALSNAA
tara:strand:- start:382 stop:1572 length:1191 start_codon:yes stop_codon:yes gene_type:complete